MSDDTETVATQQSRFGDVDVPECEYGQHRLGEDECRREAMYVLTPDVHKYDGETYRCERHRDDGPLGAYAAELAFNRRRLTESDLRGDDGAE